MNYSTSVLNELKRSERLYATASGCRGYSDKAGGVYRLGLVTGEADLIPQVLANGRIALAATLIINDDTIFKDGVEVEIEREFIEAGTAGYDEFIEKLRKV
jgi:hypothetical protein